METHRFESAALLTLALAWAGASGPAYGQGLEVGCTTGEGISPGTMTRMGFPCPVGAGPDVPPPPSILSDGADRAERIARPLWIPQPAGAAGVSGSSRMSGAREQGDAPDPGDPRLPGR